MKILSDQKLDSYTTVKIGGVAKCVKIPENVTELIQIIEQDDPKYFIGAGSNLLIADRQFDLVVDLRSFNDSIEKIGEGTYKTGASVRLQHFINMVNHDGRGGMEYLYSVPGLVGGAIVMNAGRGRKYDQSISDHIVSVDVIRAGKIITLPKEECGFSYRNSCFKNTCDIVVSAIFEFHELDVSESDQRKKERIEYARSVQDNQKPNFGSVFCVYNTKLMKLAQKFQLGKKVHFSKKTTNWIINEGGNFSDAMRTIEKAEKMHRLLHKKIVREVIIWE